MGKKKGHRKNKSSLKVNDAQNIEVADDGRDEEQDIVEVDIAAAEKENQKELKTATSDPFQEQVKQALEEAKSSDQTNTEEQRQVADLPSQVNEAPKTVVKKLDMKASLGFSGFPAENSSEAENPSSAVEQLTDPFSVYDVEFDEMVLTSEEQQTWDEFFKEVQREVCLLIPKTKRDCLKYLMAKKFCKENALICMYSYMNTKQMVLPGEIKFSEVADFLATGAVISIPANRDKQGRKMIFVNPARLTSETDSSIARAKSFMFLMEKEVTSVQSQRNGFVVILDMAGCSPTAFDRASLKLLMSIFEESFPARFKQIYLVNTPWWLSIVYAVVQLFLKPKLRERIVRLKTQEELREHVEESELPISLGGHKGFDLEAWVKQMKALST